MTRFWYTLKICTPKNTWHTQCENNLKHTQCEKTKRIHNNVKGTKGI
jgi:hypothetical protein